MYLVELGYYEKDGQVVGYFDSADLALLNAKSIMREIDPYRSWKPAYAERPGVLHFNVEFKPGYPFVHVNHCGL